MKGRMGLVENRPQVSKCFFVPPVTKRGGPAREVGRRQQRPALHRPESLLGLRDERLDVCLRSTKRGYERGDQLACESILRLLSLARQAGPLRPGPKSPAAPRGPATPRLDARAG